MTKFTGIWENNYNKILGIYAQTKYSVAFTRFL